MDELELRIAAAEKVILAMAPWIDQQVVEDAADTIRAEIATAQGDEREAAFAALELLTDGRNRFKPPALGLFIARG